MKNDFGEGLILDLSVKGICFMMLMLCVCCSVICFGVSGIGVGCVWCWDIVLLCVFELF